MKRLFLSLVGILIVISVNAQHLNGAWRLVEEDGKKVNQETIKLYSNSFFTYATYDSSNGDFVEAGGGTYFYEFFNYTETVEIDSKEPNVSGTKRSYKALLEDNVLTLTNLRNGQVRVWEKFDDADDYEMTTCWRIHKKRDQGDEDWRKIVYSPRKTLKMLTNNRYQVIAFNSSTGEFISSSGGTWSKEPRNYKENIEFFSKNPKNVGRSLEFNRKMDDGLWYHTGNQTDGDLMMEVWLRYK